MAITVFKRANQKTDYETMPGHWILASMGKKVLRPGGLEMSTWMVEHLGINKESDVVELAPGLGRTAKISLTYNPKTFTGVEQNDLAADIARKNVYGSGKKIQVGNADETGLPSETASVLYGEAYLTMQTPQMKEKILKEINRVLKKGGTYGLHELCFTTEAKEVIEGAQKDLSKSIRVNAKPIRVDEWKKLLEENGFEIIETKILPMTLLEPKRLIADEGIFGVLKIGTNLLLNPSALKRVKEMRAHFREQKDYLRAIGIVARKK